MGIIWRVLKWDNTIIHTGKTDELCKLDNFSKSLEFCLSGMSEMVVKVTITELPKEMNWVGDLNVCDLWMVEQNDQENHYKIMLVRRHAVSEKAEWIGMGEFDGFGTTLAHISNIMRVLGKTEIFHRVKPKEPTLQDEAERALVGEQI